MDPEAFRSEVTTLMMAKVQQIDAFGKPYGGVPGVELGALRTGLIDVARMYATLIEEPAHREKAAYNLCEALFGEHLPEKKDADTFWRTETGRAIALAIGYPQHACPKPVAGAILNLSRQRVGELITLGTLVGVDRAHVTSVSVRDRLRAKASGAA